MKDFLSNKNNTEFSTYITDINPNQITTNGALTIVDNNLPNNISGLVPNTNNIFLDNIFLASGHGFSTYNDYEKASYLITTYNDSYRYLLDQIENFEQSSFSLKYTYDDTENILDKNYNTYGFITSYKYIDVFKDISNENSYIINLSEYNTKYIDNIQFKLIERDNGNNNFTFKTDNFIEIGKTANLVYIFTKYQNNGSINDIIKTSPDIYVNDNEVNFNDSITNENGLILRYSLQHNEYYNEDINLICKRNENIIYSYNYKNFIKWRYKILAFNTKILNILLSNVNISDIYNIDKFNFDDDEFSLQYLQSTYPNSLNAFISFIIDNFDDYSVYLDDETEIEFVGNGYYNNDEWLYMHDYIVIKSNTNNLDFYFNDIKNNGWKQLTINTGTQIYKIFQSPQRYMGNHTWKIKYKNE